MPVGSDLSTHCVFHSPVRLSCTCTYCSSHGPHSSFSKEPWSPSEYLYWLSTDCFSGTQVCFQTNGSEMEIWLTQYSPGWTEQKEIEKPALRTLLTRWRAGQIQRPVFIKLDELNTHFEAMVYQPRPSLESSPDKSGLAASTRAASSVMVLD